VNNVRGKTCEKKQVKKDWIEYPVIKETINDVLTDEVMKIISENIAKLLEYEKENNEVLLALQANLKDVERQINNVMNAIKQGIITNSTKTTLLELEEKKTELEIRIADE
jgi:hypothetical protein